MAHVLDDDAAVNGTGTAGCQDLLKLIWQGYVWKLIHDAVDRNREGTAMHTVCHVIKRLEKLAVDHAYQIIQRGVCIRDTAEKGNFSFSHAGKIQFISIGQLGDLRQIEGCQPDTYTDQDGLGGLSRDKLSRTFSSNSQKI